MRFHMGFSFRLKYLKKFLLPFLIGLLAYFGFGSFGFLPVFAYYNSDSTYTLEIPNEKEYLLNYTCGNENVFEVVTNFIENFDLENAYSNVEIYLGMTSGSMDSDNVLSFYAWPKSYDMSPFFKVVGRNSGNNANIEISHSYNTFNSSNTFYYFEIKLNGCSSSSSNITSTSSYQNFLTFVNTGTYNTGINTSVVSQFKKYDYYYSPYWNCFRPLLTGVQFTESGSYTIPMNWIYYSSRPIILGIDNNLQASLYFKNIIINGIEYDVGDIIPSVYDLESTPTPTPNETWINYKNSLGTIYTNFSPNEISNYQLKVSFDTIGITALQYHQNLTYNWGCYGRVNHNNNYYTYEKFSYCDFVEGDNYTADSNFLKLKFYNLNIYDSNDNIITNFSNYDKIFVYYDFNYNNTELNKAVGDLVINFSSGNFYYEDYFLGPIYENFYNLSSYSKLFLSTNRQDYNYFEVQYAGQPLTNRYFLYKQAYDTSNLTPKGSLSYVGSDFQRLFVNGLTNQGFMFYHQLDEVNGGIDPVNLDFVIFEDIIISYSNISSNNFYYYYNGSITNGTIDISYTPVTSNDNYDLGSYFAIVNGYIERMSDKVVNLSYITNEFYDSMPTLLQQTIYVCFVLLCMYWLFREIKR